MGKVSSKDWEEAQSLARELHVWRRKRVRGSTATIPPSGATPGGSVTVGKRPEAVNFRQHGGVVIAPFVPTIGILSLYGSWEGNVANDPPLVARTGCVSLTKQTTKMEPYNRGSLLS